MIDIISQIYTHVKSPYDIYSLMIANKDIYLSSDRWRREKWTYHSIPLSPYQVNLADFRMINNEVHHFNFPEKHQLSILCLCKGRRTIVITNAYNMKSWIKLIKTASNFNIDPFKTKIFVNHNTMPTHYKCPNKLALFDGLDVFITTNIGFNSVNGIINKDYIIVCDYDILHTVVEKHCSILNTLNKSTKIIIQLVPQRNAKYAYKRIIEYYTPQVNIIHIEPTCDIQSVISLFKNKRPVYIATDHNLDLDAKEYIVKDVSHQPNFYDDGDICDNVIYIDKNYGCKDYVPCNNVITIGHDFSAWDVVRQAKKPSPLERDIEIIIIPSVLDHVDNILRKKGVKHNTSSSMLAYKLCKAFGYDISTLNGCELTILFGRDAIVKIEDWESQSDNKFTREQVVILLKQLR